MTAYFVRIAGDFEQNANASICRADVGIFTTFETGRQFSSYSGMAPLDDSSGSCRNRGRHIQRTGTNRHMKALLTQAARAAVIQTAPKSVLSTQTG
ncbi:MAG: IS110 family transposase [Tannerella sp.]|jgi:transposase|nr:IS110 family transposase [Tannerella sp.]